MSRVKVSSRSVKDATGLPNYDLLVRKFGGAELSIPTTIQKAGRLVAELGSEIAATLVDKFGGKQIYVSVEADPLGTNIEKARPLIAAGHSDVVIASAVGVSERQVRNYRKALEA